MDLLEEIEKLPNVTIIKMDEEDYVDKYSNDIGQVQTQIDL